MANTSQHHVVHTRCNNQQALMRMSLPFQPTISHRLLSHLGYLVGYVLLDKLTQYTLGLKCQPLKEVN